MFVWLKKTVAARLEAPQRRSQCRPAGILGTLSAPAVHARRRKSRWRMATSYHPFAQMSSLGAPEQFARQFGQVSGGRFQVSLVPSEEPVASPRPVRSLQGEIRRLHVVPTIRLAGRVLCARQHRSSGSTAPDECLDGRGQRWPAARLPRPAPDRQFPRWAAPGPDGGRFRMKAVLAGSAGLRMQIGGLGARAAGAGAAPQQLAPGEVAAALERDSSMPPNGRAA